MTLGDDLATRILVMAGALLGHLRICRECFSHMERCWSVMELFHIAWLEVETYYLKVFKLAGNQTHLTNMFNPLMLQVESITVRIIYQSHSIRLWTFLFIFRFQAFPFSRGWYGRKLSTVGRVFTLSPEVLDLKSLEGRLHTQVGPWSGLTTSTRKSTRNWVTTVLNRNAHEQTCWINTN